MRVLIGIAFGGGVLADSSASLGMTVVIGVGIGFVSYVSLVFGLKAIFALFIFDAEVVPFHFVAGDVLLYSGVLELLELADCFEEAAFYSLLVGLETLDDC